MVGFWCCIISCKLRKAVLCDYAFQNMISVLLIAFGVSVSIDGGEISGIQVACQVQHKFVLLNAAGVLDEILISVVLCDGHIRYI